MDLPNSRVFTNDWYLSQGFIVVRSRRVARSDRWCFKSKIHHQFLGAALLINQAKRMQHTPGTSPRGRGVQHNYSKADTARESDAVPELYERCPESLSLHSCEPRNSAAGFSIKVGLFDDQDCRRIHGGKEEKKTNCHSPACRMECDGRIR